ncbi:small G protein signaling modulator 1-like isoform X2 [Ischnura elegans]|uniref:small G protein signaling modulator 1-like isoform X2 n=1 Tax=Ischnura elegans TaxID=197161 RepID=UPI001ED8A624|nr:small G protein signaling modulator 1-like isoform X2 [Ischnura elegans]
MAVTSADEVFKEKLIRNVKKEVKQIMEEAVTRKFVHEESSTITSLCAAVEACLSQGLRRRALGLFKSSSTTALLHKVAKTFEPAATISQKVLEIENADPNRRSSSSSDSTNRLPKPPLQKKNSSNLASTSVPSLSSSSTVPGGISAAASNAANAAPRYLWIRLALFEKQLAKIIDHLVQNSSKYYEKDALVSDPDYGSILSSLLVGPCALDYSKTKTQDHFWTDPPADELVQRHRISTAASMTGTSGVTPSGTPPLSRRPALNFTACSRRSLQHTLNSSEDTSGSTGSAGGSGGGGPASQANSVSHSQHIQATHHAHSRPALPASAKEYVESLHQNSKATLLYGKNNVLVLPKDITEPMPGYLSLHQTAQLLTIKWTPNQLMNGYTENETQQDKSLYWDYAMNVNVDEIVYVHCHQQADSGGTVVLVGQDGIQHPPIHFPKGGHLLAFLSCLETGLLPHGQLDPPLWSQRGKGKVFPKLRRRGRILPSLRSEERKDGEEDDGEEESTDYVFRIVNKMRHEDICGELLNPTVSSPTSWGRWNRGTSNGSRFPKFSSSTGSSTSSSKSLSLEPANGIDGPSPTTQLSIEDSPKNFNRSLSKTTPGESIQLLCATMKRQIISRGFYGWLAYCRHLTTVRTHLSGLVNQMIISSSQPTDATGGLTVEKWKEMMLDGQISNRAEVFRLTYYGGVSHELRKEVWPYLLGHYTFGSAPVDRETVDNATRRAFETTMSEWLAVEAIVRQRDREAMAANLAKLSSESTSGNDMPPAPALVQELSNDVFEDAVSITSDDNAMEDDDEAEDKEDDAPSEESHMKPPPKVPPNSLENPDLDGDGHIVNGHNGARKTISSDEGLEEDGAGELEAAEDINGTAADGGAAQTNGAESSSREERPEREGMAVIVTTNPSVDSGHQSEEPGDVPLTPQRKELQLTEEDGEEYANSNGGFHPEEKANGDAHPVKTLGVEEGGPDGASPGSRSNCISPASSNGGVYSMELLENFGLNLHRIDKDVQRCDRNYWYFTQQNLEKLRNVMCTYVWEHLDVGYMQGMCDLAAPLLVILDDEATAYSCFCRLMERMQANFPNGGAMDTHFANMRSLIQILDSEMFELMHQNGDYTHFYFCYRWFLLDFKRELLYEDVFSVWETIWAAKHVASAHFVLFLALALVQSYRDIILAHSMDFTDIIKFFNEMAERHDAKAVLSLARDLVLQLQTLIENK